MPSKVTPKFNTYLLQN